MLFVMSVECQQYHTSNHSKRYSGFFKQPIYAVLLLGTFWYKNWISTINNIYSPMQEGVSLF